MSFHVLSVYVLLTECYMSNYFNVFMLSEWVGEWSDQSILPELHIPHPKFFLVLLLCCLSPKQTTHWHMENSELHQLKKEREKIIIFSNISYGHLYSKNREKRWMSMCTHCMTSLPFFKPKCHASMTTIPQAPPQLVPDLWK